jgi:hypothetical protein
MVILASICCVVLIKNKVNWWKNWVWSGIGQALATSLLLVLGEYPVWLSELKKKNKREISLLRPNVLQAFLFSKQCLHMLIDALTSHGKQRLEGWKMHCPKVTSNSIWKMFYTSRVFSLICCFDNFQKSWWAAFVLRRYGLFIFPCNVRVFAPVLFLNRLPLRKPRGHQCPLNCGLDLDLCFNFTSACVMW